MFESTFPHPVLSPRHFDASTSLSLGKLRPRRACLRFGSSRSRMPQ